MNYIVASIRVLAFWIIERVLQKIDINIIDFTHEIIIIQKRIETSILAHS